MPYNVKHNQKALALDLRHQGQSYHEIQKEIAIPKSTLADWLREVKLTKEQKDRLIEKQKSVARRNAQRRILEIQKSHQEIVSQSMTDIQKISRRELWLLGIMLYGKECWSKKSSDARTNIQFTSSDDFQIKLFLKWLRDVGTINGREISFYLFLTNGADREFSVKHWAYVTEFSQEKFTHVYKKRSDALNKVGRHNDEKNSYQQGNKYGQLHIRVGASSLLARQIAGWMKGIEIACLSNNINS